MRMPEALPLTSMPPMTSPMKSGQMPVRQYSVHLERGNGLPTLRCMVGDTGARGDLALWHKNRVPKNAAARTYESLCTLLERMERAAEGGVSATQTAYDVEPVERVIDVYCSWSGQWITVDESIAAFQLLLTIMHCSSGPLRFRVHEPLERTTLVHEEQDVADIDLGVMNMDMGVKDVDVRRDHRMVVEDVFDNEEEEEEEDDDDDDEMRLPSRHARPMTTKRSASPAVVDSTFSKRFASPVMISTKRDASPVAVSPPSTSYQDRPLPEEPWLRPPPPNATSNPFKLHAVTKSVVDAHHLPFDDVRLVEDRVLEDMASRTTRTDNMLRVETSSGVVWQVLRSGGNSDGNTANRTAEDGTVVSDRCMRFMEYAQSLGPTRILVILADPPTTSTNTARASAHLAESLCATFATYDFPSFTAHGAQPRAARDDTVKLLRDQVAWILVTTQEGGRKLNLDRLGVEHVVFYGWPTMERSEREQRGAAHISTEDVFLKLLKKLLIRTSYRSISVLYDPATDREQGDATAAMFIEAQRMIEVFAMAREIQAESAGGVVRAPFNGSDDEEREE